MLLLQMIVLAREGPRSNFYISQCAMGNHFIPEDSKIVSATNSGEPVIYTQAPSAKAYVRIAKRILGQEVPFVSLESEGVMGTLKRIFK